MIDWHAIETVFLDMDGTLLDLHFDNHFWREHLPRRYAEKTGTEVEAAKGELFPRFQRLEGTMQWYCLDYWSAELELDITALKREIQHLIKVHPHVFEFLDGVRAAGKQVSLVTNAHPDALSLKLERTRIDSHFDQVISSHMLGLPKEAPAFWGKLQRHTPFHPTKTLLIDDSLPVLRSARRYGIGHLFAVYRPDSRHPPRDVAEFQAIHSFADILPPRRTR